MSFFDDFSKTASSVLGKTAKGVESVTKNAVRKGSDFAEVSKLKMKISAEQKSMDDLYYEIGKKIYEDTETDGLVPQCVLSECSAIYEHKARIAELNGRVELIRGGNQYKTEESESDVEFYDADETVVDAMDVPEEEDNREPFQEEESSYTTISETVNDKNNK